MASSTNTPTKWSKNVGTPWKQREHNPVNITTLQSEAITHEAKDAKWKVTKDQIKEKEESILIKEKEREHSPKKSIYQPKTAQPLEEMNAAGDTQECTNFRREKKRQTKAAQLFKLAQEKM